MSVIEKLSRTMGKASGEWNWKFSYAPKPGQQRIKIVATRIGNPKISKTMFFTEDLCKALPEAAMVRHIMNLLTSLSTEHQVRNHPQHPSLTTCGAPQPDTLESQYHLLRKSYELKVSDLKEKSVPAPRTHLWLSLLGLSLRNMQIVRK